MLYTATTEHTIQMSWEKGPNEAFLSVLAKRTYRVDHGGRCRLADQQEPWVVIDGEPSPTGFVTQENDVYPFKPLTDVVVLGHAYAYRGERTTVARIDVGPLAKTLGLSGERRCSLSPTGRIQVSEPEPFDKIALSYENAYGGHDKVAEEKHGNPLEPLDKVLPGGAAYHSPYIYPRNGAGKGYLIEATPEAVEGLELPNIEDPADPIVSGRLVVGDVLRWPMMPLPWGTSWLHPGFFPRVGYTGTVRNFEPFEGPWPEVKRGFCPAEFPRFGKIVEVFDMRFFNGASLGLQLPPMRGNVGQIEFRLSNMHPHKPDFRFRLPGKPPQIWTDGRAGTLKETEPVIHHVVIKPDDNLVTVVWRGSAPAKRIYMDDELERMPYKIEW